MNYWLGILPGGDTTILSQIAKKVFGVGLRLFFGCLASVLFLFIAFIFFPLWLSTHTIIGAFVYYAVLIFYYSVGWRRLHK